MTNNLRRNEVGATQDQKTVTINESDGFLDQKLTASADIDFTGGGPITLTDAQWKNASVRCINVSAAEVLNTPTNNDPGYLFVDNTAASAANTITVTQGSSTVVVPGGESRQVYQSGAANGLQNAGGGGGGGSISVEDDNVEVVAIASTLNFGSGLNVSDAGGGQADIDLAANLPQPIESQGCLVDLTATQSVADDTLESDQTPAAALSVLWDAAVFNDTWIDVTNNLQPQFWLGAPISFADTDITVGTDQIAETAHGRETGMGPYTFSDGGGTAPTTNPAGQLDDGDLVWFIRVDADNFQLATSYANAIAGTAIDITVAGTGTFSLDGQNRVHVPAGIDRVRVRASARFADAMTSGRYGLWVTHNDGAKTDGLPRSIVAADTGADEFNQISVASGEIPVEAGDWFEVRAGQISTAARNLEAADTWFSVEVAKATGFALDQVLWVEDEKAANTNGGAFTAGSYVTRILNTIRKNTIPGASVSSNAITLSAGTYRITASAPANDVNRHKTRLRNTTDASTTIVGSSEFANGTAPNHQTRSMLQGEFTISAEKTLELQHRCETSEVGGFGLGVASNLGEPEIYASVFIEKIA